MTKLNRSLPCVFFSMSESWFIIRLLILYHLRQKTMHVGFKAQGTFYLISIKFAILILQG